LMLWQHLSHPQGENTSASYLLAIRLLPFRNAACYR
jgi:hypothetical protein